MELFLLKTFAFLRPLLSINVELKLAGVSLFDIAGIGFIAVLAFAFFIRIALGEKNIRLSSVDIWMIAYVLWCIAISLIYPDKTDVRELIKWITPFFTYIVAGKILRNRQEYLRVLSLVLIAHVIPVLGSAAAIALNLDFAINKIVGATELAKYQGVYANSGNMGLSMTLFVIMGVIYANVTRGIAGEVMKVERGRAILFLFVAFFALYCLIIGQSRTGQIGLILFFASYFYQVNRKWLLIGAVLLGLIIVILSPILKLIYYDVIRVQQGERPFEEIASGRPYFWAHNMSEFLKVTPDRLIAGVGIGNLVPMYHMDSQDDPGAEAIWSSHNDILAVLVHTGVIGFLLFLGLHIALLRKILSLEGRERAAFVALLLAITAMNFASNSYVSRYALAQVYYLVMVYIELARPRDVASSVVTDRNRSY